MDTRPSEEHTPSPEALVERARGGDKDALEQLVRAIQDPVYGLSLRMLARPAEAEDATQEILIKVVTRLDSFRGESKFSTWVFAVAANHLRTMSKKGRESRGPTSFEETAERQAQHLPQAKAPSAESKAVTREIQLICLHGLLLCLDRDHRLAYVLGERMEMNSTEGAQVLGIQPATFRKRLSRARQRMQRFLQHHCGLVRTENPCRCELWTDKALAAGLLNDENPRLAGHSSQSSSQDLVCEEHLAQLDELQRIRALTRSLPAYRAPDRLVNELKGLLGPSGANNVSA